MQMNATPSTQRPIGLLTAWPLCDWECIQKVRSSSEQSGLHSLCENIEHDGVRMDWTSMKIRVQVRQKILCKRPHQIMKNTRKRYQAVTS